MLEINRKNARMLSMLGARGTFGYAINDLAESNDFAVLSADLCESSGLAKFRDNYGSRFFNVGIAEQNLIGVSAGIASEGANVFATSFSPFITCRCLDQIRMNLGYMHMNVKLIGLSSGYEQGSSGYSHYGLEDASVISCIPGITVVTPADCSEIYKCIEAAMSFEGPMYIRLTGGRFTPIVYTEEYDFRIGKAITMKEGTDIAVFACGTPVAAALKAAKVLEKEGISVKVVNVHTLKPFDSETVREVCAVFKNVLTLEEHNIHNGLGTAVAEVIAANGLPGRLTKAGAPDSYEIKAGDYGYMMKKAGLDDESVSETIRNILK